MKQVNGLYQFILQNNNHEQILNFKNGDILSHTLHTNNIAIHTPCSGLTDCGRCVVHTSMGNLYACKTVLSKEHHHMMVFLDSLKPQTMSALQWYQCPNKLMPRESIQSDAYAVAIDIGTTTIVFEAIDLSSGIAMKSLSMVNRGRLYGHDVMTRITHSVQGARDAIHQIMHDDLIMGIAELIHQCKFSSAQLKKIVVAGNTTMMHILQNFALDSLGVAPFQPISTDIKHWDAQRLFKTLNVTCDVILLPCISAFVGADTVSGLLFCGWQQDTAPHLFIDIGTNGEIALFHDHKITCTSSAAGPALEGGNISCGIASIPGAIYNIRYSEEKNVFNIRTINDVSPAGLCGTAIIDLMSELLTHDLMDPSGVLNKNAPCILDKNVMIVSGADPILFSQNDVRAVQLAKASLRAGIEILLEDANLSHEDIKTVYLAGGFGYNINVTNACRIGLLPMAFQNKTIAVGNASLGGCALLATHPTLTPKLNEIKHHARDIGLMDHPSFHDLFIEYMTF